MTPPRHYNPEPKFGLRRPAYVPTWPPWYYVGDTWKPVMSIREMKRHILKRWAEDHAAGAPPETTDR